MRDFDPMVAEMPAEVPLGRAPLIRVLAQLRFPMIASIERPDFIGPFQEAIRADYPLLQKEETQAVAFGPGGAHPVPAQTAWRFQDKQETWRVSLATEFLALETTAYESHQDFLSRLRTLVIALAQHIKPARVDRLGVRYIDRICPPELDDLTNLVRPEVRGIVWSEAATHLEHTFCESRFAADGAALVMRCGYLPPHRTSDPNTVEPIDKKSWILDFDMFSATLKDFSVDAVMADAEGFAKRIYTVFRWAVTDDFLRRYGGKP